MGLIYRNGITSSIEHSSTATTSAEYGATITASGTAHTKGSYTELIASTARDSWGIMVGAYGGAVASTRVNFLVDIAIGASSSEVDIIPNLLCGNIADSGGAQSTGRFWYFPIVIPAGTRISSRCQANTISDTIRVRVWLYQYKVDGNWYGSRVTAYGPDTATSTGVSASPGNNTYSTAVNLAAGTTIPIKYLQISGDLLTDTTGSSARGLIKLNYPSSGNTLVEGLPYQESTTTESVDINQANMILAHMRFAHATGGNLSIEIMRNVAAEARGWAAYGVD